MEIVVGDIGGSKPGHRGKSVIACAAAQSPGRVAAFTSVADGGFFPPATIVQTAV